MNIDKAGYCISMRFYMFSLYVLFVFVSGASYCMYVFISVAATKRNQILIESIVFCSSISFLLVISGTNIVFFKNSKP